MGIKLSPEIKKFHAGHFLQVMNLGLLRFLDVLFFSRFLTSFFLNFLGGGLGYFLLTSSIRFSILIIKSSATMFPE